MPFRIRIFLSILLALLVLLLIGPLLLPTPELEGTVPAKSLVDEGSLITVDGVSIHYLTEGSGAPALVLLHGYPSSSSTWRDVIPELSLYARTVAYDRPGFGLSERPEPGSWDRGENPYAPQAQVQQVLSLLDELEIGEAVWIGSSSGALTALQVALEHSERVAGLVLVGAPVFSSRAPPRWLRPLLSSPQMNRAGPLLMRQLGGPPGVSLFASQWADPERIDDEDVRAFRRTFQVDDWDRGLWEVSKASRETRLAERLEDLRAPALVVAGAQDEIVPPEESEALARELPNATLELMEGCGHLPQEECSADFIAVVIDWLNSEIVSRAR